MKPFGGKLANKEEKMSQVAWGGVGIQMSDHFKIEASLRLVNQRRLRSRNSQEV